MRVGDEPRTTTNAEACDHCVIITATGCCATCGLQVEAGGIEVGPEASLERGEEPDWEGKGEPQGERGRVGRLLGIRRDESIVEAARRARERIEALEGDLKAAAGELLVEMPEPGSDMARLLSANVLLRRSRDAERIEAQAYRRALLAANKGRRAGRTDEWKRRYERNVAREDEVRAVLGAERNERTLTAARRVMLEHEARRQWVTCEKCGDEVGTGKCPTCSFDEGATDDVGPGERLLLREVLVAREGETLVEAAQRVAGERGDALSEAQAWRDAKRILRLIGLGRGEP